MVSVERAPTPVTATPSVPDDDAMVSRLNATAYCRLGPSRVDTDGVGVFTIRPVPRGTVVLDASAADCRGDGFDELVFLSERHVARLEPEVRRLVVDLTLHVGSGVLVPDHAMHAPHLGMYVNHSDAPNIALDDGFDYITLREIAPGEELLADYATLEYAPRVQNWSR